MGFLIEILHYFSFNDVSTSQGLSSFHNSKQKLLVSAGNRRKLTYEKRHALKMRLKHLGVKKIIIIKQKNKYMGIAGLSCPALRPNNNLLGFAISDRTTIIF